MEPNTFYCLISVRFVTVVVAVEVGWVYVLENSS